VANEKQKRCYYVYEDEEGTSIVAYSAKEAKKLFWNYEKTVNREVAYPHEYHQSDWIDLKVMWQKHVDVSDLEVGTIIESIEGLYRGCYGWVEYEECPLCGKIDTIHANEDFKSKDGRNFVSCNECYEKEEEHQWKEKINGKYTDKYGGLKYDTNRI
jgi:hypothetical protein